MRQAIIYLIAILTINNVYSQTTKEMNPDEIIIKLEELEYFKFLQEDDKPDFKKYLKESIETGWLDMPNQVLIDLKRGNKIQRDKPESIDKRSNVVDGEYLFRGGLETILKEFKPLFETRNLQFSYNNNNEEYSGQNNNFIEHKITVNESTYQIFKGELNPGTSEMEYLKSLLNLLNNELAKQDYTNEKFFVLSSMETLYYLLINTETENFIQSLNNSVKSKIINLNKY